jgi:hypothetical protein
MTGRTTEPPGWRSWLVLCAPLVHIVEEWPRFPGWATEHFGTTSPRFYLISHIPIVAVIAWAAYPASRSDASSRSIWFLAMIVAALGANGLFHAGATVRFGAYSPGLVTSVGVYLPLAGYLLPRLIAMLGVPKGLSACVAGVVVAMLVTASLALDMPA